MTGDGNAQMAPHRHVRRDALRARCSLVGRRTLQIAYVAYKHLDAPVKDRVDALLRLNPDYAK